MEKRHWKFKLFRWYAEKILRVPFIIDFTPANYENVFAIGFAWTPQAANRMRGDDMLIERLQKAEAAARAAGGTRAARRIVNRAAKRAASGMGQINAG